MKKLKCGYQINFPGLNDVAKGQKSYVECENVILKPNKSSKRQMPWHKPEKNTSHSIYLYEKTKMGVSN